MTADYHRTESLQQRVASNGERLSEAASKSAAQHHLHTDWLSRLINKAFSDPEFRIQALRFVDVLPNLNNDHELAEHLQEYFSVTDLPPLAKWGLSYTGKLWSTRVSATTVRYTLRGLARRFMGGSKLHHALTSISRLRHKGMNFTLDLLGEATISEAESEQYQQYYLHMMQSLSEPVNNWQQDALLDTSHGLSTPRLNLSIKLSSLYSQLTPCAPEHGIEQICVKLRPILRRAMKTDTFITIDMEQYDFKHIVLGCFRQIIMEDEFINWPHIGIAMQAYLKDTYDDIKQLLELLEERDTPVTIRLVRGAYWDYETVIAKQNNWPSPVWENKNDTDYNYEHCLYLLLTATKHIHTAIASHNPRSIAFAMALTEDLKLSKDQFEFQMLYGMADTLKYALTHLGYRVRVYVPYGETLPGMAYLVRRLLENSSGQSMLESGFGNSSFVSDEHTFDAPEPSDRFLQFSAASKTYFKNQPLLRFTDEQERNAYREAIKKTRQKLAEHYPLLINGKEIISSQNIHSYNPANPKELIGTVSSATQAHADLALQSASESFRQWKSTPVKIRADYLRRVATLLTQKRMEFSAWQILETGKNWTEADADVCEAIDFLNYYAQQAELLAEGKIVSVSGELNQTGYKPRGVCLVITPWNFPLAILCGMLCSAIVTGNTCILKPSSLTPVIAAKFVQLWLDTGLPDGVINFLPGSGSLIGNYLAQQPGIHIISFTGSLQVGTQLLNIAAQIQPEQQHIKKVIAEMGGKNALIIDNDADLDDAIIATLFSAFSFQGQKCSAASRVIVVEQVYEKFVDRLLEATKSLISGDPTQPQNFTGPVIDSTAFDRISQIIAQTMKLAMKQNIDNGYDIRENSRDENLIKPCIFFDVDPLSPLAQDEIFGPVLAVIKARSFAHAIEIANSTRYALTGGVYSRQPSHLQYAREHFHVGNLYLNRKITGALVERQPFGGFGMSGAGSKAGGADYLLQFVDSYCITENTLRRGFAPDAD
ncbi:MAG TPA: aldehyde dehydrogenase family protein [Gammaproteobacteria bacterium]|nr:aldehyde dehydrogenase family protein [Gammaproteobacteria bacterium]